MISGTGTVLWGQRRCFMVMKPTMIQWNKNEAIYPTEKSVYRSMLYLLRVFRNDEDVQNLYFIICSLCLSFMTTANCERGFSTLISSKTR